MANKSDDVEFPRAVAENGNVVRSRPQQRHDGHRRRRGGKVWEVLTPHRSALRRRDSRVTTDFHDVFAEVVVRHLGVTDPAPIFRAPIKPPALHVPSTQES
jgi:hypothetical protein